MSSSPLSAIDRAKALSFTIPGKSSKQLEDWCRQYRYEEWSKVTEPKDRFTFVQIVQRAQKEMRGEGEEDGNTSEVHDTPTKGKRKVSLSHNDMWIRITPLPAMCH